MITAVRLAALSLIVSAFACASADSATDSDAEGGNEAVSMSVASIVGGVPAVAYPESAILDIDRNSTGGWYACSGTLIAPNVVLTAGHCVDTHTKWGVYVQNEYRLSTSAMTYDWAEHGAETVNPLHHDLALVFLDEPIALASYPTIARSPLPDNSNVLNIGRIADGTFTSASYEAPAVVSNGLLSGYPFDYVSLDVIQPGDSGGAVMATGTHTLVAVNSGAGGGIQVLARVDLLASWIATQIAAHTTGPGPTPPTTDAGASLPDGGASSPDASASPPVGHDAGASPPDAGTSPCAAEKESNDTLAAANAMSGSSFCGALGTSTDVDWVRFDIQAGTTMLRLSSSLDAVFAVGRPVGATCGVLASAQKSVNVVVVGGSASVCVAISSPTKRVQPYTFTVTR